jgi:hypothetical protein
MADSPRGIGSSGGSGGLSGLGSVVGRDQRAARDGASAANAVGGATPNGPRGRRMLSADTPVESLDRTARRGTYLDILA